MAERIVGAHVCACGQYGANPYVPMSMRVLRVRDEVDTRTIKTFDLAFVEEADAQQFRYLPGQFCEVSVFGVGESPFGIASSPTEEGFVRFTVSKAGVVALTESVAADHRRHGVAANVILPSIIDTPDNRANMPDADPSRWVTRQQIAEMMRFLCSEAGGALNGASIAMYGQV